MFSLATGQLSWERIKNYHKEHNKASLAGQGEMNEAEQPPKPSRKKKLKGATAISSWRSATHGIRTILTVSTETDLEKQTMQWPDEYRLRLSELSYHV